MLSDYLTIDCVQTVDSVENWEEAIKIASEPLLENQIIEEKYIENMIQSVHDNGPYIVLNDYFALPHAKAGEGVNEVGLSLLIVNESVDLLGKPVKLFLVLAAIDSQAHMQVLSEISEILMDEANFEVFLNGNQEKIIKIIENNSKGVE